MIRPFGAAIGPRILASYEVESVPQARITSSITIDSRMWLAANVPQFLGCTPFGQ